MKSKLIFLGILLAAHPAWGQSTARLFPGLGDLHHPIATKSAEAQKYFDQGLTLCYAFNHEEAIRSFRKAAELDPGAVMPLWGIAYAMGPNINADVDAHQEKAAFEAAQKAVAASSSAPEGERDYVEAIGKRYSADPKADLKQLARDYAAAMKQVMLRHPDDPDAATIYAESLMIPTAWRWWSSDGKPAEGTEEAIAALESVLRRDPMHIGANHYYIHAVEESPHPEYALPSAARLPKLTPAAGHLVHMPSHIYGRTGDYPAAVEANQAAVSVDEAYLQETNSRGSVYGVMSYNHNLDFLAAAAAMEGNYAATKQANERFSTNVTMAVKVMPMAEFFLQFPARWDLRFSRWDDVLVRPLPPPNLATATLAAKFARAMAWAGKGDVKSAESGLAEFDAALKAMPAGSSWGYSDVQTVFGMARHTLEARIAASKGDKSGAIEHWRKAVEIEDSLPYDEPPDWYYPVRESLGAALLLNGQASEGEAVFREDLRRNPRNGRSLFGLWESLLAQKRTAEAAWVKTEFDATWKMADVKLDLKDF